MASDLFLINLDTRKVIIRSDSYDDMLKYVTDNDLDLDCVIVKDKNDLSDNFDVEGLNGIYIGMKAFTPLYKDLKEGVNITWYVLNEQKDRFKLYP